MLHKTLKLACRVNYGNFFPLWRIVQLTKEVFKMELLKRGRLLVRVSDNDGQWATTAPKMYVI